MLAMRSIGISTPCLARTPVRKITRDEVTTKCVNVQFRYCRASQPAQMSASTAQNHHRIVLSILNASTSRTRSGIPLRMWREKYHQCGRRSSATSSPSLSRRVGYGTPSMLGRIDSLGANIPREDGRLVAVVGVVRIEVLGNEEATGALGQREPVDQRVVGGAVVLDEQVGQLVHEHVVEDPRREARQTRRHA